MSGKYLIGAVFESVIKVVVVAAVAMFVFREIGRASCRERV